MLERLKARKPDGFIDGREQNMGTRGVNIGFGVKRMPKALMLLHVCRMCKLANVCKTVSCSTFHSDETCFEQVLQDK